MGAVGTPSAFPAGAVFCSPAPAASASRNRLAMILFIWLYSKYITAIGLYGSRTTKMARGWESKSVEAQIDMAQSRTPRVTGSELSTAQVTLLREKENILLSRTRVL